MLTDVGLRYSMVGAEDAISKMKNLHGGFSGLSSEAGRSASSIKNHLETISSATSKMAHSIHSSMNIARAGFGVFMAGKALSGVADWIGSTGEAGQGKWTDYFRNLGGDVKAAERNMADLRRRIPDVGRVDYMRGAVDALGMLNTSDPKFINKAMESTIQLHKGLGPDSNREQATDILRSVMGTYGEQLGPEGRVGLMEKVEALVPEMIKGSAIRGHELAQSMPQLIGIYHLMGKSLYELGADISTVGKVMGGQTGEVLRSAITRFPEAMGKMASGIGKHEWLQKHGFRREAEIPEKYKPEFQISSKRTQEEWEQDMTELQKSDPREMYAKAMRQIQRAKELKQFDYLKAMRESYGETSPKGLLVFLESIVSGSNLALVEAAQKLNVHESRLKRHLDEQSYEAAYGRLKQRSEDLQSSLWKGFKSGLGGLFEPYGKALDRIADTWRDDSERIAANMTKAIEGFGAGFTSAFGGFPDVVQWAKQLSTTLADPEARKSWEEWGKVLGQDFGGSLKSISESLEVVKAGFGGISTIISGVADASVVIRDVWTAIASTVDKYIWGPAFEKGWDEKVRTPEGLAPIWKNLEYEKDRERRRQNTTPYDEESTPYRLFTPKEAPAGPVAPPASGAQPTDKTYLDKLDEWFLGLFQKMSSESSGSDKPEIKQTFYVTVGNREIRDFVVDTVEEHQATQSANQRQAAGNAGFARPWLG